MLFGRNGILSQKKNMAYGKDFEVDEQGCLIHYHGSERNVTVPDGIKGIGSMAFFQHREPLERVILPDSVEEIKYCAFNSCTELIHIRLSSRLKTIEEKAFKECINLKEIELPDSVVNVGEGAFKDCRKLYKVKLSAGLKNINDELFERCICLQEIDIPESVIEIGRNAFWDCGNLRVVHLPRNLYKINAGAFEACKKIEVINIPETITFIGKCAFSPCAAISKNQLSALMSRVNQVDVYPVPDDVEVIRIGEFRFYCRYKENLKLEGKDKTSFVFKGETLNSSFFKEKLELDFGKDAKKYCAKNGDTVIQFYEEVPTFDYGDRESDSYRLFFVVIHDGSLTGIYLRGGYILVQAVFYSEVICGDSKTQCLMEKMGI